jgi:hypothetical protein
MQAGFRNGYSTATHLLLSDELSRNGYPLSVFLDLQAAYDSVNWRILRDKLSRADCATGKLKLITSLMLQPARLNFIINRQRIGHITSGRGLFQGSILSPCLFNVYINDLVVQCNNLTPTLLFADDINIKASSATTAQQVLDICHEWAARNHLKFGIKKCAVVAQHETQLTLGGDTIPPTKEYKYLGAPHLWNRVAWEKLISSNCLKHSNCLIAVGDVKHLWTPLCKLAIWRTFFRPKLEYCLSIAACWWLHHPKNLEGFLYPAKDKLEREYKEGICFVTASRRHTETMSIITGIGSFTLRLQILGAGLSLHLAKMWQCNPLQKLRNNFNRSKFFMMNCIFKNQTYLEFLKFCDNIQEKSPNHRPPGDPFRTFKKQYVLNNLCNFQSKLRSYMILPMPGLKYRFDNSMLCKSPDAVRWRCGSYKTRATCPKCLKQFNRAHITRCSLLEKCQIASHTRNLSDFKNSRDALLSVFISSGGSEESFHYTVIDYLINRGEITLVDELLKFLRDKFDMPTAPSRTASPGTPFPHGVFTGAN